MLLRLTTSNLTARKTRTALTVSAIALSVSLVVCVTSGYASIEAAAFKMLSMFYSDIDAKVVRQNETYAGVPQSLLDEVSADPAVASAVGRIEISNPLLDVDGKPIGGRSAMLIGITRPQDRRVESMEMDAGGWFDTSDGDVCVPDQVAANLIRSPTNYWGDATKPSMKVGETIELPGPSGNLKLKMVGIVHKPKILAMLQPSIYVPIQTLAKWSGSGGEGRYSNVLIDLDSDADPADFGRRWRKRLAEIDPVLQLKLTSEQRGELDKNLAGLRLASYLGGAISMLAAGFIIFSALSMGVNERQRTLAMLRAIGAEKRQLGALVVVEGVLLAALGVIVGVPLGLFWVQCLYAMFTDFLSAGVAISVGGIAFASAAAVVAALLASILPAWGAMRTDPLEAMSPLSAGGSLRRPLLCAIPGVLLIAVDPLILFAPWRSMLSSMGVENPAQLGREIPAWSHFIVGLPALMFGFFLLAPLIVVIVERTLGPLFAAAMGVRFALLRQQLTGGVWRSAGTAAALMVGLAILIVLQVQGNTVVGGWRIPDKFPDMFITTYKIGGLLPPEVEKLKNVKGIRRDQVLPIAIASPEFGSSIFTIRGAAAMPEATMFFGVDPKLAMEMMQLDFRDGTPQQAVELMTKNRRHILVTEEFRQLKGLKTGDKMQLKTPKHGLADYTIAGVVWSPGIDVIVSMFDLGKQFEQRTAASVFGTLADARDDFGVEGVYLFAVNLEGGVDKETLAHDVRQQVGTWGLQAGDVREVKYYIVEAFRSILLLISTVAFAAMAVASLGVANTIMAGVRSRRWQFGIMRSIGVTRGQLVRLVITEAALLGVVGSVLGLLAGGALAINAKRMLYLVVGLDLPFVVPWGMIAIGVAVIAGISILAGLWPAASVARSQPLALLQAGRSAG